MSWPRRFPQGWPGSRAAGFNPAWSRQISRLIGASMYPRNAASPERIAIGAVVQISDGAVQTSGVSVTVTPQGGAEGAGGGTTSYSATGTVRYVPTQAETNYASFLVEASKTGCIPVSVTVVTTASSTSGTVVMTGSERDSVADALLNRNMASVSDTNARSPLNAFRFIRNKWSTSGSTLTVTKEDDAAVAWTAVVTTTPGADPITGNDPG